MANKSTPDVYLLFGLKGGDSLTGASGHQIEEDLTSIINQLEDKIVFSLKKINADAAFKQLKTDIDNTISTISKETEKRPISLNIKFNEDSVNRAITALENKIKKSIGEQINVTPNINVVVGNGSTQASTSAKSNNNKTNTTNTISSTQKEIKETKKNVENAAVVADKTVNLISKFVTESANEIKKAKSAITISTKNSRRPLQEDDVRAVIGTWGKYYGQNTSISAKKYKELLDASGVDIFGNTLTGKSKNKLKDIDDIFNEVAANFSKYFESTYEGLKLSSRGFLLTKAKDVGLGSTAFTDAKEYQKTINEIIKLLNLDVSNNRVIIGLEQLRNLVDQIVSEDADIIKVKSDLSRLLDDVTSDLLSSNQAVSQKVKTSVENKTKEVVSNAASVKETVDITEEQVAQTTKQETAAIASETEVAEQNVKELESSAISVAKNVEKTVDAVTDSVQKSVISIDDIERAVKEKTKAFTSKSFVDDPNKSQDDLKGDKADLKYSSKELLSNLGLYRTGVGYGDSAMSSSQLSQLYSIINSSKSLWGTINIFDAISDLFHGGAEYFEKTINDIKTSLYADVFPNLKNDAIDKLATYEGQSIDQIYKSFTKVSYNNIKMLDTLGKYLSNDDPTHTIEGYTSYLNDKGLTFLGKKNSGEPYTVDKVETILSEISAYFKTLNKNNDVVITTDGNISYDSDRLKGIVSTYKAKRRNAKNIYDAVNSDEYKAISDIFDQASTNIEPVEKGVSKVKKEITSATEVTETLKNAIQDVSSAAEPAFNNVEENVKGVSQTEQQAVNNAEKLTETIAKTDDSTVPALGNTKQKIQEIADVQKELSEELVPIYKKADNAQILFKNAFDKVPKTLKNIRDDEIPEGVIESVEQIENQLTLTEEYIQSIPPAREIKDVNSVNELLANELVPIYKKADNAQILIKDAFDKIPKTLKNIKDDKIPEGVIESVEQIENQLTLTEEYIQSIPAKREIKDINSVEKELANELVPIYKKANNAQILFRDAFDKVPKKLKDVVSENNTSSNVINTARQVKGQLTFDTLESIADSETVQNINNISDSIEDATENIKEYKDVTDDAAESTKKLGDEAQKSGNKMPAREENRISKLIGNHNDVIFDLGELHIDNPSNAIKLYDELYNRIIALREAIISGDYSTLDGIDNQDEALREINILLSQTDKLYKRVNEDLKDYGKESKDLERIARSQKAIADQFPAGANAADFDNDTYALASMEQRLATVSKRLDNLKNSQLGIDDDTFYTLYARLERARELIEEIRDGLYEEPSDIVDAVDEINEHLGITEKRVKEVIDTATNVPTDAMTSIVEKYNKALAEFRATQGSESIGELYNLKFIDTNDSKNIDIAKYRVVALTKETERLVKAKADLDNSNKKERTTLARINEIYQKAYDYYNKYYSGISKNKELDNQWTTLLKDLNNGMYSGNAEGARQAFTELQVRSKQANVEVTGLWDSIKKLFSAHFGSFSILTLIGTIRNGFRAMYQDVLEIDKAMTELRKVTDLTEAQYEAFGETAARIAKSVSGSITDTINSVADFARLGFNIDESSALAEAALVYKNVGDGIENISEASESIISTIKAFSNIEASDAMSIIDKFNEVGNNYAISSVGIGTALQKSAAALASANNSLDESIAIITAGNSVVQNPEIVGTAAKTISMYLRTAKTEAEEAGLETDGMAESVSKLRSEIKSLSGVDIMLNSKDFKSTYQILKELSEAWDNISDVSRANILEKIGGKRNANIIASIIENFDIAEQVLQTSLNAEGSALAENEKYLDSIAGHINKVTIAFEELSQNFIESNLIKTGADVLTNTLTKLNDVLGVVKAFPVAVSAITLAVSGFKNIGFITKVNADLDNSDKLITRMVNSVRVLGKSFEDIANDTNAYGNIFSGIFSHKLTKKDKSSLSEYQDAIKDALSKTKINENGVNRFDIDGFDSSLKDTEGRLSGLSTAGKEAADKMKDLAVQFGNGKISASEFESQTKKLTTAHKASKVATIGLSLATSVLNAAISMGLSYALQGLVTWLYDVTHEEEKLAEKVKEATDAYKSQQESLEDLQKEYENIIDSSKSEIDKMQDLYEWKRKVIDAYGDEADAIHQVNLERQTGLDYIGEEKYRQNVTYIEDKDVKENYDNIINKLSDLTSGNFKLEGLRSTKHNLTDEDIMNFFITEIGRLSNGNITAISSITGNMATASGVNVTLRYGNDYQDAIKNIQDIVNTIHNIQTDPKNGRALTGTEQLILDYFANLLSEYEKAVDDSKGAISEYNQALYDVAWHEFRKANKKDLTKISEEDLNEYLNNFSDYLRRNDLYSKYFNSVDFKNLINSKSEDLKVSLFPESLIESNDIGYISSLKEKLGDLDDSVKTLLSNKDTIESTLKKVRQGLVLTEDEVQKLKEISPDLLGKFKETDGGWTISESDLVDTYDKQLKNVAEKINEHRIKIKNQIDGIKSQFVSVLDSVPSEVAEKIKNGEYSNNTYFAPSREDAQKLKDLNNQYSALNVLLSMIALDVNNVNEKFREYNSTIEYSAKLGSNLSTLNAATALSNSISLYSKSDDWERDFDKQARAMQSAYIENKELTEAYNRWYSNRNTTTAKALVEVYKKAYNDDLNNFNSYLTRKASDLKGYEDDKSVWKQFVEDNETAVAELAELYAIDLANVTTYAEARDKILEATSTKAKNFTNLDYLPTSAKAGINSAKNTFTEYFQSVFLSWFTQDPLAGDTSVETGLAEKSYSQSLDKIQQANSGTIEAEKKFVKEWIALNDEFYATTDPEKYKSNLREIASYIAGFSKTISENLAVWARENDHNDNSYADRLVYLQVWEQSSQELYGTLELLEGKLRAIENVGGDTTATLKSILDVKKAIDEDSLSRASYEAETYKLKYESGYYQSFDEYKKDILSLGDTYKTTEDKSLLDGTFFDKYIDANAEFEGKLKEYTRANEKTAEAQTTFFKSVRDTLTDLRFRKDDHMDPSDYLEHYMKDYADPYVKWLKEQMDKGLKTPEDVANEIQKLYDNAKDKDQVDLGKDWLADALNIDSYEYDSKQLMKINDKTFKSEQEYVAGMKKLAYERYGDSTSRFNDLTKYESSMKSIIDYELAMLKKAFQEGKISAKEYAEYITQILDEKTGKLLGADYVADQTKDALEARGNREKTYWEQQKKLMTKYYDTEIEKLQEIKNEREKEAAVQKLQLNLIKARIELEKAKSQRNILQFKDGVFEYVADQDAVKSAEEEVANALDEIRANELDKQIELLEKQKDNASAFYDDIIEVIDAFMNHTTWIAESDSEYLKQARESQEGQETKEYQAGNIAPNQLTQDQLDTTGTSDKKKDKAVKAVDTAHENKKADSEELNKTWSDYINKPLEDLAKEVKELTKVIGETNVGKLIFGSSGTDAQQIVTSGMSNIVTNGNMSNDNSIKVGDVHVTVQGGTSQDMLMQFANNLSSAITTMAPKLLTN